MSQLRQEIVIATTPAKVYTTLIDSEAFAAFSGAPAEIDATDGGAFSCFGGMILGRNVELAKDERIVQAWRVANWPEGVYTIVAFSLAENDGKTTLSFTQSGVPEDQLAHIDPGWHNKYWKPLKAYLES